MLNASDVLARLSEGSSFSSKFGIGFYEKLFVGTVLQLLNRDRSSQSCCTFFWNTEVDIHGETRLEN